MEFKYSAKEIVEDFNSLPRRAQELIFEHIAEKQENVNSIFTIPYLKHPECRSPIEQIFWLAFSIYECEANLSNYCVWLEPQYEIMCGKKKYVVDFLVMLEDFTSEEPNLETIVIECDGHEFHERTKEQVRRDNERQLSLKMNGYDVVRLSGSQIYNDPMGCAEKIYRYIVVKWKKGNEML